MKWTALVFLLALATPALAGSKASIEEWQYLQRVGVVSSVNEDLWKAFEDSGGWNPELARYAQDATRLNVRSLRSWGPPARPLVPFHTSFVNVMVEMQRFYGAVAERNFGRAEEIGAVIRREMIALESAWADVAERYTPPASR